jgi:hypothetical protein
MQAHTVSQLSKGVLLELIFHGITVSISVLSEMVQRLPEARDKSNVIEILSLECLRNQDASL